MKAFYFVTCLVATALARPEAGYSYQQPAQAPAPTYHAPAPTYHAPAPSYHAPAATYNAPATSYSPPASGSNYNSYSTQAASAVSHHHHHHDSHQGHSSGTPVISFGGSASSAQSSYAAPAASVQQPSYSSNGGYNIQTPVQDNYVGAGTTFGNGAISQHPISTIVQKHIYVHVPPPDSELETASSNQNQIVQNQKHYKIIFIKAPSPPPAPSRAAIAAAQNHEEKTIVYVLVKKPEDQSDYVSAASTIPQQPSKPEVYFIKYKTQSDLEQLGAAQSIGNNIAVPAPQYGPAH